MRFFIISNGLIENVVEAPSADALEGVTLVPAGDLPGGPGWLWNDGSPVDPDAPPPPTPSTDPADYKLTMRQLRLGLVENGFGANFIPNVIASQIPPGVERDRATVWYEETVEGIEWGHPMTQALIAAAAQFNPAFTSELAAQMWLEAAAYAA